MDGARIFNAAVALRVNVKEFTKHVDNLMFCLSKSLSCPVGSLVVGSQEFIEKAKRYSKGFGWWDAAGGDNCGTGHYRVGKND